MKELYSKVVTRLVDSQIRSSLGSCIKNSTLPLWKINRRTLSILSAKLNSYSNASIFLSLCRMCISIFWGHKHLTDTSISKCYLKGDIATWVEKSSTSRVIHACDTGLCWSSENALHERFIANSGVWVRMKMLQLITKWWVWIQLDSPLDTSTWNRHILCDIFKPKMLHRATQRVCVFQIALLGKLTMVEDFLNLPRGMVGFLMHKPIMSTNLHIWACYVLSTDYSKINFVSMVTLI